MSPLTPAPKGYPIKLVRDRTAEIVNPSEEPGDLFYGPINVDSEEYRRLLRLKLAEEVGEYLIDEGEAELCDVAAVLDALARLHGTTLEQLLWKAKDDPRGGFVEGVVMYGRHPEYDR